MNNYSNGHYECYYQSPFSLLRVVASEDYLQELSFIDETQRLVPIEHLLDKWLISMIQEQLDAWFAGKIMQFDLPLQFEGTAFQQKVWHALQHIPFGETCSYSDIAQAVGNPKAVRAVGSANGKNPISIIVPCHRVINKNGKLGGYGGGLARKRWLLAHEQKRII